MSVSRRSSRPCAVNLVEKSNIFISRSSAFTSAAPDAASWEWGRSPRGNDLKHERIRTVLHIQRKMNSTPCRNEKRFCEGKWDHTKYPHAQPIIPYLSSLKLLSFEVRHNCTEARGNFHFESPFNRVYQMPEKGFSTGIGSQVYRCPTRYVTSNANAALLCLFNSWDTST